ncbi:MULTISPECIES: peptide ABC transporter substrate-binding protein [Bacillus]|jgi:oligopeptide transport system substrate-binding protein|uniref:Periplasmic oligopeptide-binding protein OppA n=8 Tax=Bacillus cereus group TaxID=86661 RepID=A0AAJ1LWN1_BACCE|nr:MULTISPECIES: peptide ABC transporter substrate-binding protein [Bacillus]PAW40345.1 peptide ABC transporter substrate-binding protein [Bacillus toyonensis]AEA17199.1 oligopeptide-binding protein oppA [Bacillus thuringiensis serovar chinensis CT-43]AFV19347.1 dipeptide-binding protein DppE [Bacillus thuringiensis Bt407]AGG02303.1 Oligopeptide ABC transporter, periplasmic oligopeptide-binding protein OppA [Bacillus thuringiensis serovar thuringiensis str. IS5056]ALC51911.1 peptide ABC transp
MKKKMKKFTAVVAPVLAMSMALTACSGSGGEKKSTTTSSGGGEEKKAEIKYAAKQVLNRTENQEIPTMDVSKSTDTLGSQILGNTMEGLYRLDKDNKPIPAVAESSTKSEDGKKYTFKLRKDAKWSNGDPVTAKDFVYGWQRLLDKNTAAEYAFIAFYIKNAEAINKGEKPLTDLGAKAVDDYTLEVELEKPVPYFLNLMAFPSYYPLNEKFVKEKGDKFGLEADTTLYNGPFVMASWKHEQGWQLKKNDQYWDKKTVKLEEINYSVVKEVATKVNLYDTGSIDFTLLSGEFVDKYKSNKEEYGEYSEASTFFLRLNQKRNGQDTPLKSKKLREAIALSIDKKGLANVILNNGSKATDQLVPKGLATGPDGKDYQDTFKNGLKYDPKKGAAAWEAAKKELGKDQVTIELLSYDDGTAKKIADYFKDQIEKNLKGVTVNTKIQPFKQKLKLESAQDYEVSFAGWSPDYSDPMTFIDMFESKSPYNQMSYSNPKYDEMVAKAGNELLSDPKKRWETLGKAEKLFLEEDAGLIPLYQTGRAYVMKPNVKGIVKHNISPEYSFKWAYVTEGK